MSEWKEYTVLDFAEIHNKTRIPLSKMQRVERRGTFPYYGASGIIDYVDDYLFDGSFILISEDGENLKSRNTPIAFEAKGKFWVNNHAHILKGKKPFYNKLLIYYFQNLDLKEFITGAVQPKLNKANLLSIPIFLPNNELEQRAIASILSSLDDKIDLLHRQNKTLEAMAETLFREWFVEGAQEEWEELKVRDIANHIKENIKPSQNNETLYHHYSLPAYDSGKEPTIELGKEIKSNKYRVLPDSILVSKLNPRFPRIWAINDSVNQNAICSTEFQVFTPKNKNYFGFLLYLFKSDDAKDYLQMAASGTSGSHQRVRPQDILNIEFRIPSKDMINTFSKEVELMIERIYSNQTQIRTLTALRDTLLPKLMSGAISIPTDG